MAGPEEVLFAGDDVSDAGQMLSMDCGIMQPSSRVLQWQTHAAVNMLSCSSDLMSLACLEQM